MGSAAGRRECNKHFWRRGYELGLKKNMGYVGVWTPEEHLRHEAGTISKSFQGLFIRGYVMGKQDRESDTKRTYEIYETTRDQVAKDTKEFLKNQKVEKL